VKRRKIVKKQTESFWPRTNVKVLQSQNSCETQTATAKGMGSASAQLGHSGNVCLPKNSVCSNHIKFVLVRVIFTFSLHTGQSNISNWATLHECKWLVRYK
jgi:hypothetical protein